jgi:hypothetical protein
LESGALTVRATGLQGDLSLRLFMDCVNPAELAVLLQLDLLRGVLLVLHRGVVALLASLARKQYYVPHDKCSKFFRPLLFFRVKEK